MVRTRFAPSPTGSLHIGGIHNALFAYALAKHFDGDFILRIEDTDQKRKVEGSVEEIIEVLDEFGLTPDEGPIQGGEFGPYIQSERVKLGIYSKKAEELVKKGHAYYCFLSKEELAKLKSSDKYKNKAFRSPHRDLSREDVLNKLNKKIPYVIRLKVPENQVIEVEDAILGKIKWNSNDIDDQVLLKSDGFPTYHLAVVVDDHAMQISHVTRSYEWLSSTPKQVLLYKFFDYPIPIFAHSPLLLDPDGGKLSKRKGSVAAKDFLKEGYLPDAIKNFLMLLGWAPPIKRVHGEKEREIFSMDEFIKLYELKDRQKTNAVFNREKLIWFNQQYLRNIDVKNLTKYFLKWLTKYNLDDEFKNLIKQDDISKLEEQISLIKDRAKTLQDIVAQLRFFYKAPSQFEWDLQKTKNYKDLISDILEDIKSLFDNYSILDKDIWIDDMKKISSKYNLKPGDSFMVLRIAVTGSIVSPPLFEALEILGLKEVQKRLDQALNNLLS